MVSMARASWFSTSLVQGADRSAIWRPLIFCIPTSWYVVKCCVVRWGCPLRAKSEGLGTRRSKLLELSGMELHEVAHVRRRFADELVHGVRHAVVTPLPGQLGHGREMPDDVFRKPHLTKPFAPRREWCVAISDGPAERLGEDARIVVQIGRFPPRQIVDLSDMRCGVVEDHRYYTRHIDRRDRRGLASAKRQRQLVGGAHAGGGELKKETLEKDCRPYRDDRQSRPGQRLLRQPVQLVLRAVGGLADAHLRDRHLRHVHESLNAVVARHGGGVERGFQVGWRDRHSEIDNACNLRWPGASR